MVYIFLADGFEEMEAIAPVDILRRGGVSVTTVGVGGKQVTGCHGISVLADCVLTDQTFEDAQMLILPGGLPGADNLRQSQGVCQALVSAYERGAYLGAICAAPYVLGQLGLLRGRRVTCYPGFEEQLLGATPTGEAVVVDGTIITAKGPGVCDQFGYQLLSCLKGEACSGQVRDEMQWQR